MRRLLLKDVHFEWHLAAEQSFTKVKEFALRRVLRMLDPALPVIVATDACAYCLAAVLQQADGPSIGTVAFASQTLTGTERKYSTGERQALVCQRACEKWHI